MIKKPVFTFLLLFPLICSYPEEINPGEIINLLGEKLNGVYDY